MSPNPTREASALRYRLDNTLEAMEIFIWAPQLLHQESIRFGGNLLHPGEHVFKMALSRHPCDSTKLRLSGVKSIKINITKDDKFFGTHGDIYVDPG